MDEVVMLAQFLNSLELAEEAISYVSPYFREKWMMDDRLAELRKAAEQYVQLTRNGLAKSDGDSTPAVSGN